MSENLELKCGDPSAKPATYTRFILPFSYCPITNKSNEHEDYYPEDYYEEETELENIERRKKYLTYETADVLFNRARWFKFKSKKHIHPLLIPFKSHITNKIINIYIKPPTLVLFEYPEERKFCDKCKVKNDDFCQVDEHNILRIGFLIVETYFSDINDSPNIDDLLEFNEIFRYWQPYYKEHKREMQDRNIPIRFGSDETVNESCNSTDLYFERWSDLLDKPIKYRNRYLGIIPHKWKNEARDYISDKNSKSPGWAFYSDNRTFVWTCAITEHGGDILRRYFAMPDAKPWDFGHWIKLLNVDRPGKDFCETHKSTNFEKQWAEERTYKRWEEWGTFYGFNYQSGAMLGPPMNDPPLWQHFQQMYFDQTLLLLYIRVATFRFCMELNKISGSAIDKGLRDNPKWRDKFQQIRWSFALFTNLYQFPSFSNQQQSIEMYSIARKYMDIDDLFRETKEEIDNCHEYLVASENIDYSKRMEYLNRIATIGLVISIAISFWGMNILIDDISKGLCIKQKWFWVIVPPIIVIIIIWLYIKIKKLIKFWRHR